MKVYETTFIINPQMEDAIIDKKVNVVSEIISNNSGKILHADHMGTRKLAYQIKGLTQGYYASFIFEANTDTPKILDRHFKLDETYLRHLTVVYEGDVLEKNQKSEEQAQKETESAKAYAEKAESKPVEAKETETETETEAKTETIAETKTETEPVAEPETETEPVAETKTDAETTPKPEPIAETEVKNEVEPESTAADESSYNEDDEL